MIRKVNYFISAVFMLLWSFVILVQYLNNNPKYEQAFDLFQYSHLLLFLLALGGGISFLGHKFPDKIKRHTNGLVVFTGICLMDLINFKFYYATDQTVNQKTASFGAHFGWFLGLAASLFGIYLVIRVLGNALFKIFPPRIFNDDLPVIEAAVGSMLLAAIIFVLGIFGGIHVFVLVPLFLLLLILHRKAVWNILKNTFWRPIIKTEPLNAIGIFSFLFLGFFLVADFVQILRTFPAGTDSLNLYVNLPNLIGQSGTLIDGHQPYNWSLIMALGVAIFGRIEVVLGLSFLGTFLTLATFFRLCRKRVSVNYAALGCLLIMSLPMINYLAYMDMKIDMALAFITLSVLLIFYNWVENSKTISTKKTRKSKKNAKYLLPYQLKARQFFKSKIPVFFVRNRLLILIGLLSGFALGIKLTVLFFFFALMIGIWFVEGGKTGLYAAFFLSLGFLFLLQLDAQAQLRKMHESVDILQWILLFIGLGFAAFFIFKNREKGIRLIKISALTATFFALPILPWVIKNVAETGQFNKEAIVNGKKAMPDLFIDKKNQKLNSK